MTRKSALFTQFYIAAERAIDELRRQNGIIIGENTGHSFANYPIEFLTEAQFSTLRPGASLLITAARARALGFAAQDSKIDVTILSYQDIKMIADPLAEPITIPTFTPQPASEIDSMALKLAKDASLLPALLRIPENKAITSDWLRLSVDDLRGYIEHPLIDVVETAHAQLPLEGTEKTRIISFRARHGTAVHLALLFGDPAADKAPLVRIHSSCVTGDLLGSLRCDCGDQLKMAIKQLSDNKNGVLIYLHQEGRGIGIINKLRAYQLQERGLDTYEANLMLGFEEDERDFSIASAILKKLGIQQIRLLTNNPQKIEAVEKSGIKITERLPLIAKSGTHNHGYLEAKGKKAGHLF